MLRAGGDVLDDLDELIAEYKRWKAMVGHWFGCGFSNPEALMVRNLNRVLDHTIYFEVYLGLGKAQEAIKLAERLLSIWAIVDSETAPAEWAAAGFSADYAGNKDAAFWTALVKGAIAARQPGVARDLLAMGKGALAARQIETLRTEIDQTQPADEAVEDKDGPALPFPARDGRLAEEPSRPPS